jgi:hypothetical protein
MDPTPLQLARNRVRAAMFCACAAMWLAAWAVASIDNAAVGQAAAEDCDEHPPLIDERYAAGFRDGLQEAREAAGAG